MKLKTPPLLVVVTAGFLVLLAGCSKDSAEAPAPPSEVSTAVAPVQQPSSVPTAAPVVVPDAHLVQSQAAMKTGDYDAAAASLIAVQRAKLNEQQAAAAAAQMHQLQSSVAAAAAAGDPRAAAAAERLRKASMAR
jgi:type IV pilus biogenesis protein CpaD/CtpE